MKVLVISDTHNNNYNASKVINKLTNKINVIIHLGDSSEDAFTLSTIFPSIPMYYVGGNWDSQSCNIFEQIVSFNGVKVLIAHGHKYGVNWGYDRISYAAEEKKVQAVLFGHTHFPFMQYINNILVMNPGSISLPRNNSVPSYGILDITDNGVLTSSVVGIYGKDDYRIIF